MFPLTSVNRCSIYKNGLQPHKKCSQIHDVFLDFPFCLQEILCILLTGGSVFLNALNLASGDKIINDLLPGNIERPADKLTYRSVIPVFEHFNSDGQKETVLYF
jgi:hypothetical protein